MVLEISCRKRGFWSKILEALCGMEVNFDIFQISIDSSMSPVLRDILRLK